MVSLVLGLSTPLLGLYTALPPVLLRTGLFVVLAYLISWLLASLPLERLND